MYSSDANLLLDHAYLPLETGWQRLENGQALVAARTHLPGCTGEMIKWWFGFVHHTEEYLWWHPRDHVWSDWDGERGTGNYIGGAHLVHEYIGVELYKLRIFWEEPSTYLDTSRFAQVKVSAVICGKIGDLDSPKESPMWLGKIMHLIQETEDGCVMRSRFWLGELEGMGVPVTPELRREIASDALAEGLLQHCCEEMSLLGTFLPKVFEMYQRPGKFGNAHALPYGR
jgi:hypothetical protein